MSETAQIIIAVGTAGAALVSAITSLLAMLLSSRNGRKIEEIHVATNGINTAFNKLTAKASHAEGLKEGREEGR